LGNSIVTKAAFSYNKMAKVQNKACLIVIDGWGISPETNPNGDAIRNAKTPNMDSLAQTFPNTSLGAHGLAVGLPDGLMGNSEVGHLNIGAGRVVYQDIVRIEQAIIKDSLKNQPATIKAFTKAKKAGRIHLLGLVSDGGVHSHIVHLKYLLKSAKEFGIPEAYIHFFGDGRDTAPKSAVGYLTELLSFLNSISYGKVATIVGRYYAMDRDKRWERIKMAYEGLVQGLGEETDDPLATIQSRYAAGETDEFLKPIIVDKDGCVKDNDTLLFFNFRSDRMREITLSLGVTLPFETKFVPQNIVIM
jgi:2,3-bisphosphoglycerate-independent phosphoglycerate mutase